MIDDFELAHSLFPRARDVVAEATAGVPRTSQMRGVATSDSEDGSVNVILDAVAGGDNAELTVPTTGGITEGSDVIVTLLDGSPVDCMQAGSIDNANARIDVLPDQIISTVSQTYATKDEALNTASGSGRSITTDDAAGLPLRSLTVYGESVQDGTPTPDAPVDIQVVRGRNLAIPLDSASVVSGITITPNADGSVSLSGTSTTNSGIPVTKQVTVVEGSVSYVVSVGSIAGTGISNYGIVGFGTSHVITPSSDFKWAGVQIYIPSGTSVNATIYPQIERGSTANPYIPYGSIGVQAVGKNLLDDWKLYVGNSYNSLALENSVFLTAGEYTFSLVEITGATLWRLACRVYSADGNLVNMPIRRNIVKFSTIAPLMFDVNDSGNSVVQSANGVSTSVSFKLSEDVYMAFGIMFGDVSASTAAQVQLELGTEPTEYEPFRESITYINLQGNTLASLPDGTRDVLHVEQGRAWIEKNVGEIILDGSETFNRWGSSPTMYTNSHASALRNILNPSSISDRFQFVGTKGNNNMYHDGEYQFNGTTNTPETSYTNGNISFRSAETGTDKTVASWKEWVAANPIRILYELGATELIDLGEVSLPTVQDGDTVRIIAEVQPVFDASWWRDTAIVEYTAQNETRITQTEEDVTTAITTAQAAQDAVSSISTIIRQYSDGVLVCKTGNTVGALVNADGSFDVVSVSWSGETPTAGDVLASFDADEIKLAASTRNATIDMLNGAAVIQAITTFLAGADRTSFGIKSNDVAMYGDNTIVLQIGDVPEGGGLAEICGFSVRKNIGSSMQYLSAPFETDGTFPMSGAQLTTLNINWNGVRVFTTGDMHAQNNNDGRAIKYSPDVLFNDENAALGNEPTLIDSISLYNRARIYAKDNNGYLTSVDVVNPGGKLVNVFTCYPDTNALWINCTTYLLDGTSVTVARTGNYDAISNSKNYGATQIAITRVEAWNE